MELKHSEREVPFPAGAENARVVRAHIGRLGWSPGSGPFERYSRTVRVSPIQLFERPKGNSGGTAENFSP